MHPLAKTALEIVTLLAAGLIVAAIGNQCVDRTLKLNHPYFKDWPSEQPQPAGPRTTDPNDVDPTQPNRPDENGSGGESGPDSGTPPEGVTDHPPDIGNKKWDADYGCYRLQGIKIIEFEDVQNYADLGDEVCLLIDARKMDHYTSGHIPGAFQVDYYRLSDEIEKIQDYFGCDFIIVYCNGGDCEDSLALAHDLIFEYQVDDFKVWVYEGGFEEWKKQQQPIVDGEARR